MKIAIKRRGFASNALVAGLATLVVLGGLVYLLVGVSDDQTSPGGDGDANGDGESVTLHFYCAAGLRRPVQETIKQYGENYDAQIQPDFGPTGALLSKIQAAKKGDLYLAADKSFVDLGRKRGVIAEALPIAKQKAVIAVQKGNPKGIRSVADLLRDDVKYAICNTPASIGKLTKTVLETTGQWEAIRKNAKVMQDTVNQITNSVKVNSVDAAIVWDANAKQHEQDLDFVTTKEFDAAVQHAYICVLTSCKHPAAALRFCRYLQAPDKGGLAFARHGYETVDGDPWVEKPTLKIFSGGVNRIAIQNTIREFEEREGVTVNVAYNGCGILVSKIKGGERPDAYFACDTSFMTQVQDLYPGSLDLSETDMVIAVKKGNPKKITDAEDLTEPDMRIGVANEKESALGALTVDLLNRMGLYKGVAKNVRTQTPTADLLVAQLLVGNLDAVIVYRANLTKSMDKVEVVEFNRKDAQARQPIAMCSETKYKYLTGRLIDALRTADSKQRFLQANFRWLNKTAAN